MTAAPITRRSAIGAIASLAATAAPGSASAASPLSDTGQAIEALQSAHLAYEEACRALSRAEERYERTKPETFVPLPFDHGRVLLGDYDPADRASAERTIEREFATVRNCLAVANRLGDGLAAPLLVRIAEEELRIAAELEAAKVRKHAFMVECGFVAAVAHRDAMDEAYEDAVHALIASAPRDLVEVGQKAAALAEHLEGFCPEVQAAMLTGLLGVAA